MEEEPVGHKSAEETKKPRRDADVSAMKKAIISKTDWHLKIRDQNIRAKWIDEAMNQGVDKETAMKAFEQLFNESMWKEEYQNTLRMKEKDADPDAEVDYEWSSDLYQNYDERDSSDTHTHRGILYVDDLVPESLRESLSNHLDILAELEVKDFHPGADGKVQDLIHPSLFPYVHGESFSTNHSLDQRVKRVKHGDVYSNTTSESGEDDDDEDDEWATRPEIVKYFNDFFPNLSLRKRKERLREFMDLEYGDSEAMFTDNHLQMYKTLEEAANSKYQWLPAEFKVHNSLVTIASYINNLDRSKYASLYQDFASLFGLFVPLFQKLRVINEQNTDLQVIVKAANYIIEPGQSYEGTWHVEGTPNEHIVASGIYYYHVDDGIEDCNQLAFREKRNATDDRVNAAQSLSFNVNIGAIDTSRGRCVVFKNQLQHKVRKITNNTNKQILRKIVCFFLVDPNRRVHSSLDVPAQQWDRVRPLLSALLKDIFGQVIRKELPDDIIGIIVNYARWGFTWQEAENHRLLLMKERKYFKDIDNRLFRREYSFCEH